MSSGDLTAASPVLQAVFGVLQDATLQAAIGGRLFDDIPEDTPRPCMLMEILDERDLRGFGMGTLPELDLRTHAYSDSGSMMQAQDINRQAVALLKDAALTVTGFSQAGRVTYRRSVTVKDEVLHGVKVHEIVSLFTVWVEQ